MSGRHADPSRSASDRFARWLVRAASLLVPSDARRDWLEEWFAELTSLGRARSKPVMAHVRAVGLPGPVAFAL